jgi:hypothetical protein
MDDVLDCLGKEEFPEFERVMEFCQRVLDNPTSMVGSTALVAAVQLAALRTKIGMRGQYYKTAVGDVEEKRIYTRRKNLLLTMYNALEENINTLKALGKVEARMEDWT